MAKSRKHPVMNRVIVEGSPNGRREPEHEEDDERSSPEIRALRNRRL